MNNQSSLSSSHAFVQTRLRKIILKYHYVPSPTLSHQLFINFLNLSNSSFCCKLLSNKCHRLFNYIESAHEKEETTSKVLYDTVKTSLRADIVKL